VGYHAFFQRTPETGVLGVFTQLPPYSNKVPKREGFSQYGLQILPNQVIIHMSSNGAWRTKGK
tara:strand:+ start:19741 stop:19929 length:189 start_codon:yes stop_codon:yes gene_type:complete